MTTSSTPPTNEQPSNSERRNLLVALALITGSLVVEIGGAFLSGSLALLADAADMVTNFTAISLALLSLWMARRPATVVRTFGLLRTEVLVAMINALALWVIAAWIFIEAYERLEEPPEIEGGLVLIAGLIVLACNVAAAWTLYRSAQGNISIDGAFRHILADALGSIGVVISGALVMAFGWTLADPIVSIALAVFILISSVRLLTKVFHVLLEGVPDDVDVYKLYSEMEDVEGVTLVHDIHVWTIASGYDAVTAHVMVDPEHGGDTYTLLRQLTAIVRGHGNISHVTIQIEPSAENCTENHHVDHLRARARGSRRRKFLGIIG